MEASPCNATANRVCVPAPAVSVTFPVDCTSALLANLTQRLNTDVDSVVAGIPPSFDVLNATASCGSVVIRITLGGNTTAAANASQAALVGRTFALLQANGTVLSQARAVRAPSAASTSATPTTTKKKSVVGAIVGAIFAVIIIAVIVVLVVLFVKRRSGQSSVIGVAAQNNYRTEFNPTYATGTSRPAARTNAFTTYK